MPTTRIHSLPKVANTDTAVFTTDMPMAMSQKELDTKIGFALTPTVTSSATPSLSSPTGAVSGKIAVIDNQGAVTLHSGDGTEVSAFYLTIDEESGTCEVEKLDEKKSRKQDKNTFLILCDEKLAGYLKDTTKEIPNVPRETFVDKLNDKLAELVGLENQDNSVSNRLIQIIPTQKEMMSAIQSTIKFVNEKDKSAPDTNPVIINIDEAPKASTCVVGFIQTNSPEAAAKTKQLFEPPAVGAAPNLGATAGTAAPATAPAVSPTVTLSAHGGDPNRHLTALEAWKIRPGDDMIRDFKPHEEDGKIIPGMYKFTLSEKLKDGPVAERGNGLFNTQTGEVTLNATSSKPVNRDMYKEAAFLCGKCLPGGAGLVDLKVQNMDQNEAFEAFRSVIDAGLVPLMVTKPPVAGQTQADLLTKLQEPSNSQYFEKYKMLVNKLTPKQQKTLDDATTPTQTQGASGPAADAPPDAGAAGAGLTSLRKQQTGSPKNASSTASAMTGTAAANGSTSVEDIPEDDGDKKFRP